MAFLLVQAVVPVGLHLLALPAPLPQLLAIVPAAISLSLYPGVGKKKSAAPRVGTPDLWGHGLLSRGKPRFNPTLNFGEEQESDSKKTDL